MPCDSGAVASRYANGFATIAARSNSG